MIIELFASFGNNIFVGLYDIEDMHLHSLLFWAAVIDTCHDQNLAGLTKKIFAALDSPYVFALFHQISQLGSQNLVRKVD